MTRGGAGVRQLLVTGAFRETCFASLISRVVMTAASG